MIVASMEETWPHADSKENAGYDYIRRLLFLSGVTKNLTGSLLMCRTDEHLKYNLILKYNRVRK